MFYRDDEKEKSPEPAAKSSGFTVTSETITKKDSENLVVKHTLEEATIIPSTSSHKESKEERKEKKLKEKALKKAKKEKKEKHRDKDKDKHKDKSEKKDKEKKKKNKERERPDVPALFAGMSTVQKIRKFTPFNLFLQKFRENDALSESHCMLFHGFIFK